MRFFSIKEGLFLLAIITLVMIVWLLAHQHPEPFPTEDETDIQEVSDEIATISWNTYQNDIYEFSIQYPSTWKLALSDEEIIPMITIFKPGQAGAVGALDHFANRTHVSIYPRGIPTEGVFNRRFPSRVEMSYPTELANDLVLTTGEPWASEYKFTTLPESWGPSGFIWARNKVSAMNMTCYRGTTTISTSECDPLFGDELVREGEMNTEDRMLIERMLSSFRFIDPANTGEGLASNFDIVVVDSPQEGALAGNPLTVSGKARGTWFFEGSFSYTLLDANGQILAEGPVEAEGNWMTTEYVPFYATFDYETPETSTGTLILNKANPSGLPEHAGIRKVNVVFRNHQ